MGPWDLGLREVWPVKREKIAVVEDEADLREVLLYNLAREGYEVCSASDGEAGLQLISREDPQLILLDLMLPGLDGIEVCRRLKAEFQTRSIPIIMVTAKGEESDVVLGLGLGADDYVTKPFSPKELIGRVKAVLRRGPLREDGGVSEKIDRGPVTVDSARHQVWIDGTEVPFTLTEFGILRLLVSQPGRVFTREQILTKVAGDEVYIVDRNVDVHIRAVRRKLGEHASWIETIRGVGYRFRDEQE